MQDCTFELLSLWSLGITPLAVILFAILAWAIEINT